MGEDGTLGERPAAVTRTDVARYAGVSTAVVSYVVNGGPKPVSEATTARVLDAVARLGYRPNRTARALALGSTKTLGLVVPDNTNPFYAEYTLAIQQAATDLGYALLITNSGFDPDIEFQQVLDLCDRQIDGLILARGAGVGRVGELARRGVRTPVVLIDSTVPFSGYATVGPDSAGGIAEAVDHLLGVHRHPSVALIIGDTVEAAIDGRESGWTAAHARAGRPLGPIERAAFTREGGYAAGVRLLRRADRPTAIVASSDLQAVGLLRAVHEHGLRVPDDVAVVSFDGTAETQYCWPPLTTSRQPTAAMAQAAVQALLRDEQRADHQRLPMELVIRDSCGC
ncbi:MAG: LacI family DNA-binding transcriptional regulator [Micropruina sp.]|uniref:LacI family DNA-binding transcriptional regulator n=1 Tax=Micropruina sp. TaxID=2737536 RepID=UPI0039E5DCFF